MLFFLAKKVILWFWIETRFLSFLISLLVLTSHWFTLEKIVLLKKSYFFLKIKTKNTIKPINPPPPKKKLYPITQILLVQAIVDERNGYEVGILNKSPDQIKQLLQLWVWRGTLCPISSGIYFTIGKWCHRQYIFNGFHIR